MLDRAAQPRPGRARHPSSRIALLGVDDVPFAAALPGGTVRSSEAGASR